MLILLGLFIVALVIMVLPMLAMSIWWINRSQKKCAACTMAIEKKATKCRYCTADQPPMKVKAA